MTPHPLDPLTAEEIRAAAAILRRDHGVGAGPALVAGDVVAPRPAERVRHDRVEVRGGGLLGGVHRARS